MMSGELDKKQKIQEKQYDFPYHYLLDFDDTGLAQYRCYPGGIYYAASLLSVLSRLRSMNFESIIDIGCGDGFFCRKLWDWFPEKKIIGVDYSIQAVSLAQLLNRGRNIEFIVNDIATSKLDMKFDVATSISVLEHIQPTLVRSFVKNMHRMLAPKGKLIISVPSIGLPLEDLPKHYQHFTEKSLTDSLSGFFEILELSHIVRRFDFLTWLLTRSLNNRWFLLKHERLRNSLFQLYLNKRLPANASNGTVLLAFCQKR